jgi:hypothetical protein
MGERSAKTSEGLHLARWGHITPRTAADERLRSQSKSCQLVVLKSAEISDVPTLVLGGSGVV